MTTILLNYKRPAEPLQAKHTYSISAPIALPAVFDISSYGPEIWDQGNLGSCTAHGTLRSAWYALKRHCALIGHSMNITHLSRAFQYAVTRLESGEPINQDDGGTIHGAFHALEKDLCVDEAAYTYTSDHFFVKPPQAIYNLAKHTFHKCVGVDVPQTAYWIKHAIFQGRPVVFGADVYSSFMSDAAMNTGVIPYPDVKTETLEGGHCLAIVGWNDPSKTFLIANSWGTGVGLPAKQGYFTMPYKYIEDPSLVSELMIADVFY